MKAKSTRDDFSSSWAADDSCTCSCIIPGHSKVFIITKTSTKSAGGRHAQLFA